MSKFMDEFKEKELVTKKSISKDSFNRAKEKNPKEVYEKHFEKVDGEYSDTEYYRLYFKDVKEDEIDTYLNYELLKEQRNQGKKIGVIMGIMIASAILAVIGAIIAISTFAKLGTMLG